MFLEQVSFDDKSNTIDVRSIGIFSFPKEFIANFLHVVITGQMSFTLNNYISVKWASSWETSILCLLD